MAQRSNREGEGEIQESFSIEVTPENGNHVSKGTEVYSGKVSSSSIQAGAYVKKTQSQLGSGEMEKGDGFLMTLSATETFSQLSDRSVEVWTYKIVTFCDSYIA